MQRSEKRTAIQILVLQITNLICPTPPGQLLDHDFVREEFWVQFFFSAPNAVGRPLHIFCSKFNLFSGPTGETPLREDVRLLQLLWSHVPHLRDPRRVGLRLPERKRVLWSYLPTFILNPKSLKILSLIVVWERGGRSFCISSLDKNKCESLECFVAQLGNF